MLAGCGERLLGGADASGIELSRRRGVDGTGDVGANGVVAEGVGVDAAGELLGVAAGVKGFPAHAIPLGDGSRSTR